ncbi:hypothetical protein NSQ59_20245 [Margalitia sp. FSL K6-0131]
MIIYEATKSEFISDVTNELIEASKFKKRSYIKEDLEKSSINPC